jgi:hypothetical protein
MNFPQLSLVSLAGCVRCRRVVFRHENAPRPATTSRVLFAEGNHFFALFAVQSLNDDSAIRRLRHRETKKYP